MNKENIDIIKAEGELVKLYADEIPELAWSTGPVSYDCLLYTSDAADE